MTWPWDAVRVWCLQHSSLHYEWHHLGSVHSVRDALCAGGARNRQLQDVGCVSVHNVRLLQLAWCTRGRKHETPKVVNQEVVHSLQQDTNGHSLRVLGDSTRLSRHVGDSVHKALESQRYGVDIPRICSERACISAISSEYPGESVKQSLNLSGSE